VRSQLRNTLEYVDAAVPGMVAVKYRKTLRWQFVGPQRHQPRVAYCMFPAWVFSRSHSGDSPEVLVILLSIRTPSRRSCVEISRPTGVARREHLSWWCAE